LKCYQQRLEFEAKMVRLVKDARNVQTKMTISFDSI